MDLPAERGPISRHVKQLISRGGLAAIDLTQPSLPRPAISDAIDDDDIQLALFMLYELHYRGFDNAGPDTEWNPTLLTLRAHLEQCFVNALTARVTVPVLPEVAQLPEFLFGLVAADNGPKLAKYLAHKATDEQFCEFVIHRSAYHSKEADPYTWVIPRLLPVAKSALVEIQADEYGGGRLNRMHQELFRKTMRGMKLNDSYSAYVESWPAVTLAAANVISLFGLHRKNRAAACGHFAALEMSSSIPNRNYGNGLRRLGYDQDTTDFFDEHVEADAVHEQLAVRELCAGLVAEEPDQLGNIVFGVATYLEMERALADHLLTAWNADRTSLRSPDADLRATTHSLGAWSHV